MDAETASIINAINALSSQVKALKEYGDINHQGTMDVWAKVRQIIGLIGEQGHYIQAMSGQINLLLAFVTGSISTVQSFADFSIDFVQQGQGTPENANAVRVAESLLASGLKDFASPSKKQPAPAATPQSPRGNVIQFPVKPASSLPHLPEMPQPPDSQPKK